MKTLLKKEIVESWMGHKVIYKKEKERKKYHSYYNWVYN